MEGLKAKEVDMCGVVETGVNEGQVVEGGRYYNWYGSGRPIEEGRGGGVGWLIKKELEVEILESAEDILMIRVKGKGKGLSATCVYQKCEGVDREGNKGRLRELINQAREARRRGICI